MGDLSAEELSEKMLTAAQEAVNALRGAENEVAKATPEGKTLEPYVKTVALAAAEKALGEKKSEDAIHQDVVSAITQATKELQNAQNFVNEFATDKKKQLSEKEKARLIKVALDNSTVSKED